MTVSTAPAVDERRRDPERTRERILNAALAEFAAGGLAGARIQSIARRAGVNARMLYHYFGEKDDLFRAIVRRRMAERPVTMTGSLSDWFRKVSGNPDWVRLGQWEALESAEEECVDEDLRRERWAAAVDRIRVQQAGGRMPADLDPDLLLIAVLSLVTYPVAARPVVRMITGANPEEAAFKRRYAEFLDRLSEYLGA